MSRKQVNALFLLAMLAFGHVDAVSQSTTAVGIATLAIAAHGARDDGSRAISVHSAGRQVLANSQEHDAQTIEPLHSHNQSLLETHPCLPQDKAGWFKLTVGKANTYGAQIPFVGIFLSGHTCYQAIKNRCAASAKLKEAWDKGGGDEEGWEQLEFNNVASLECQNKKTGVQVFNGCVLGLTYATATTIAGVATGGVATEGLIGYTAAVDATSTFMGCVAAQTDCDFSNLQGADDNTWTEYSTADQLDTSSGGGIRQKMLDWKQKCKKAYKSIVPASVYNAGKRLKDGFMAGIGRG